jgi:hypothetical protein
MKKPQIYHTMRTRWESAREKAEKGDTAGADSINHLTATEALVEILDTLQDISENLAIIAGKEAPAAIAKSSVKKDK